MSAILIENGIVIPKSDFKDFAKTDDFQNILDLQLKVLKKGNLDRTLKMLSENPEISMEEISSMLNEQ